MVCFKILFQGKWHEGNKTSLNSATPNDLFLSTFPWNLKRPQWQGRKEMLPRLVVSQELYSKGIVSESGKMQDTPAWCGTFIFKEVFLVAVVEAGKGGYY